jgi:hypothetical protein
MSPQHPGYSINPLLSSPDLSDYGGSTYRSAASELAGRDKPLPTEESEHGKPSDKDPKFLSPKSNSRLVQNKIDPKPTRAVAYQPSKAKEMGFEAPTTAEHHQTPATVPSTNATKPALTENKKETATPGNKAEVRESLHTPQPSEGNQRRTPHEREVTSVSSSTLRQVSSLSSHPSLIHTLSQPVDNDKILQTIKERYKIAENRDPNSSEFASSESPQFKASELLHDKPMPSTSSDKPIHASGPLQAQQLTSDESGSKPKASGSQPPQLGMVGHLGGEGAPGVPATEYKEPMKEFLRMYIDNRLPDHLRSYRSPARVFKTRFCQRFYGKYSNFADEDMHVASYYEQLEHAKPVYSLSQSRAELYRSQLADTLKRSEQHRSKFSI